MPATLSAIPCVPAAETGAAGARLLQAAQVVVPSAICAPHMLQNAITPPGSLELSAQTAETRRHTRLRQGIKKPLPLQSTNSERKLNRAGMLAFAAAIFANSIDLKGMPSGQITIFASDRLLQV